MLNKEIGKSQNTWESDTVKLSKTITFWESWEKRRVTLLLNVDYFKSLGFSACIALSEWCVNTL